MSVLRSTAVLFFSFTLLLSTQELTAQVPDLGTLFDAMKSLRAGTDDPKPGDQIFIALAAGGTQACCLAGGVCEMLDPVSCEVQQATGAVGVARGLGSVCGQDAGPDGVDSTCADLPRMSLVPIATGPFGAIASGASIDGNAITMVTDGVTTQTVFLEVRISDWDPDDVGIMLRAFQASIDISSFASGPTGMLVPTVAPCEDDQDCLQALGGVCKIANSPCFASGAGGGCPSPSINPCGGPLCRNDIGSSTTCAAAFIQGFRSDFVLASGGQVFILLNQVGTIDFAGALFNAIDDPEPFPAEGLYAGTLVLDVGPDLRGTFTVGLRDDFTSAALLVRQDSGLLPLLPHIPAKITVVLGGSCCDELAGICSTQTEANCTGSSLRYGGDGTDCASLSPVCTARIGACCDSTTESCSIMTEAECALRGFRFGGDGSDCMSITPLCSVPTVTGWGLAILALALLTLSKLRFRETRNVQREA